MSINNIQSDIDQQVDGTNANVVAMANMIAETQGMEQALDYLYQVAGHTLRLVGDIATPEAFQEMNKQLIEQVETKVSEENS